MKRIMTLTALALCGAACDVPGAVPLDEAALQGLWVPGDVATATAARILRNDGDDAIPNYRFEEFIRDGTGWVSFRSGQWGLLGDDVTEMAGQPIVNRLAVGPEAREGAFVDVTGRDNVDSIEGIVRFDGDTLVTITPFSDGPITSTRVDSLP